MADIILHDIGHGFFNFMDPGITKFINPATSGADDMIMLFAQMGLFELGNVFAELVLDNQSAIQQQLHRVV